MPRPLAFRLSRAVAAAAMALSLALPACSGGEGGPTEPAEPVPQPPTIPVPPVGPAPVPGPPQPTNAIAGTDALRLVNDAAPGQTVTLANPDGNVIGLYRFLESTMLVLTEQQAWAIVLQYQDNGATRTLEDRGKFRRYGEDTRDLRLESEIYGDAFSGVAIDGMAVLRYDFDGNGQPDTVFGFDRVAGPGE